MGHHRLATLLASALAVVIPCGVLTSCGRERSSPEAFKAVSIPVTVGSRAANAGDPKSGHSFGPAPDSMVPSSSVEKIRQLTADPRSQIFFGLFTGASSIGPLTSAPSWIVLSQLVSGGRDCSSCSVEQLVPYRVLTDSNQAVELATGVFPPTQLPVDILNYLRTHST